MWARINPGRFGTCRPALPFPRPRVMGRPGKEIETLSIREGDGSGADDQLGNE